MPQKLENAKTKEKTKKRQVFLVCYFAKKKNTAAHNYVSYNYYIIYIMHNMNFKAKLSMWKKNMFVS